METHGNFVAFNDVRLYYEIRGHGSPDKRSVNRLERRCTKRFERMASKMSACQKSLKLIFTCL